MHAGKIASGLTGRRRRTQSTASMLRSNENRHTGYIRLLVIIII